MKTSLLIAGYLCCLGCTPSTTVPVAPPAPQEAEPEPSAAPPVQSWSIALEAQSAAASHDAVETSAYDLRLEVRDAAGYVRGVHELGRFEGACEALCSDKEGFLVGVRCWENIAGVPYVHHEVMASGRQIVIETTMGECGSAETYAEPVGTVPDDVVLSVFDNPCG